MLKKTLFQLHWFCGITAGLILSIIGITGAIYSYDQQILTWLNQKSYVVQVENSPKLTPDQLYQHLTQQDPKRQINSITIMQEADASSIVNIKKDGERKGLDLMVNPYTAEILPAIKGKDFFKFILNLHRTLTLERPFGSQITGACALMLIYFVLSGIYLRWPKKHSFKQWLFVKPKLKGRNFLWDLHAVVGTWVIVFYLMLAMTGLYWSYDWWSDGMFKVMGVDRPQPMQMANDKKTKEDVKPSNLQISHALQEAWIGFNKDYKDGFSSLTLTVPKKENGQVELSFFDATPQHERARNSAVFNYESQTLESVKKYEDKPLNEKIMSSMLPVHRGSFFGPVWHFLAMLSSLAMPLFFITGILLYLKRRKQKKLTKQARQIMTPEEVKPDSSTWLIVYASQTGTAEQLAWGTSSSLQEQKESVVVKSIHKISQQDLTQYKRILFIVSTYGTGEAPDLATSFVKKIMPTPFDLSNTQYAVLALGSKEYADTYCQFGREVDAWLSYKKANPLFPTIEVDDANTLDIASWYQALAKVTELNLQTVKMLDAFDECTLVSRKHINVGSLGAPIYLLEIDTPKTIDWQAGDIAEIQPMNAKARIQNFMTKHHIALNDMDAYKVLKHKSLEHSTVLQDTQVDTLEKQLPVLPHREYSIASIPKQNKLELVVRLKISEEGEVGLGSGWLCKHTNIGDVINLRIRRNESFHLANNSNPIILIGNGTGIAGLMSLLQERKSYGYQNNWLIFGERQREKDFFYEAELESLLEHNFLTHLDLAFSRDSEDSCYVQHKLQQNSQRLIEWVANNASIYICGSINTMAHDVEQTLINILGAAKLDELRETDRYRRDVY